jgi:hypothetical protein
MRTDFPLKPSSSGGGGQGHTPCPTRNGASSLQRRNPNSGKSPTSTAACPLGGDSLVARTSVRPCGAEARPTNGGCAEPHLRGGHNDEHELASRCSRYGAKLLLRVAIGSNGVAPSPSGRSLRRNGLGSRNGAWLSLSRR